MLFVSHQNSFNQLESKRSLCSRYVFHCPQINIEIRVFFYESLSKFISNFTDWIVTNPDLMDIRWHFHWRISAIDWIFETVVQIWHQVIEYQCNILTIRFYCLYLPELDFSKFSWCYFCKYIINIPILISD